MSSSSVSSDDGGFAIITCTSNKFVSYRMFFTAKNIVGCVEHEVKNNVIKKI